MNLYYKKRPWGKTPKKPSKDKLTQQNNQSAIRAGTIECQIRSEKRKRAKIRFKAHLSWQKAEKQAQKGDVRTCQWWSYNRVQRRGGEADVVMTQKQNYRVKFRSEMWGLGFSREADVGKIQKRDVRSCQGWSYSRWEAPKDKLRAEQMWGLCGECGDLICAACDHVKLNSNTAILCKNFT